MSHSLLKMGKVSARAVAILIFAIISIQSVKGQKFYIVTTPDSPCPVPGNESGSASGYGVMNGSGEGQRCFTLQQFVTNFANFSHINNFTLELEPGEHSLISFLFVHTIVSLTMMSEAATINCTPPHAGFELNILESVIIEGITFMGCRDIKVSYTDLLRFENSSLQLPEQGSLVLDFVLNATIIRSTFSESGNEIAALHIVNGSSVHVQDCIFSHLKTKAVHSAESTLVIDSSMFENISQIHSGFGSVIEADSYKGSAVIINCGFIRNGLGNGTLGIIFVLIINYGNGSIIHGNRFIQNTGRVFYIIIESDFNPVIIDQNLFDNNSGPGAALYANTVGASLTISQNNFTNNSDGAVNLLVYDSNVTISDCSFSSNTKLENGGAAVNVYKLDNNYPGYGSISLKILRSQFVDNSANGTGGALRISPPSSLQNLVSIELSTFSGNRAQSAGAVYIENCVNCTFGVNLTTFDNNMATEDHAGAVAIEGETMHLVFVLNSTFVNNTAPRSYAGAVYIDAAYTDMIGSTFLNNLAQYCGALALNSEDTDILQSAFISNSAVTDGGVICTFPGVNNVSILTGNFSHNHAGRNGGVLTTQLPVKKEYENKSISLRIQLYSYFDHNTAGAHGGVFATFTQSKFDVESTSFLNNQAGIEGGVMYVTGTNSSVTIFSDSLLGFNSATSRGGAISINGSSMFISDTHIFNNSADMGAVISACNSDVGTFPASLLSQREDQNFPNCVLYDVAENQPTSAAVTTATIPPTRAKHSNGIAVAIVIPIVCLLVLALFVVAVFAFAYWRGCLKCKKSVNIGADRYKVGKSDDPDYTPLMDNA